MTFVTRIINPDPFDDCVRHGWVGHPPLLGSDPCPTCFHEMNDCEHHGFVSAGEFDMCPKCIDRMATEMIADWEADRARRQFRVVTR